MAALLIAVVGLVVGYGQVAGAGSRAFTFKSFRDGKDSSRVRVPTGGTHRITITRCQDEFVAPGVKTRYKIELRRDKRFRPDTSFGDRSYRCSGRRQSHRWRGVESGDIFFQFHLNSYSALTGKGRHRFPG